MSGQHCGSRDPTHKEHWQFQQEQQDISEDGRVWKHPEVTSMLHDRQGLGVRTEEMKV